MMSLIGNCFLVQYLTPLTKVKHYGKYLILTVGKQSRLVRGVPISLALVGPAVERNGDRGRPRLEIPEDVLINLRSLGSPWTEIARMLLLSRWTLRRCVVEYGLQDVTGYSPLIDEQLDNIVTQFMYFNI